MSAYVNNVRFVKGALVDSKQNNNFNAGQVVLVADQNKNDNWVICQFLEKQGFGAVPVYEFNTMQKLLDDFTPDLIVLDSMFERSEEIVEITRSDGRTARIPIIMIRNKHRNGSFVKMQAN